MMFIVLLILSTFGIAGAAAYFSVYGLAYTFSGVFWSVVAMGTALEAGKLMAASYLYRYWDKTNFLLKSYLMMGIATLMVLTSTGIFGYLSTGYQQDILPLKQKTEQLKLLEEEKVTLVARKKEIDQVLQSGPALTTLQSGTRIDPNAARVLRETTRARESLVKQYKEEQTSVTQRLSALDQTILELKQKVIETEAHIGPIIFVAQAFNLNTDNATKYLIFLIIVAFDPMAVALTLAVNIALRIRKEEQDALKLASVPAVEKVDDPDKGNPSTPPTEPAIANPVQPVEELVTPVEIPVPEPEPKPELTREILDEDERSYVTLGPIEPAIQPEPSEELSPGARRQRVYPALWQDTPIPDWKISELVNHRRLLRDKISNNEQLSRDEQWELDAIENILTRHGYGAYV